MAHILVVDDEPGVRITLKVMLTGMAHEVTLVSGGQEGIDFLADHVSNIDLVITDIQMPKMDGLEFMGIVREQHPDLTLIAISGGGNKLAENDPLKIAAEKADDVLKKPFNADNLKTILSKHLT